MAVSPALLTPAILVPDSISPAPSSLLAGYDVQIISENFALQPEYYKDRGDHHWILA
jgi:hypothetical protein